MRKYKGVKSTFFALLILSMSIQAQSVQVNFSNSPEAFQILDSNVTICIDSTDAEVVSIAAEAFSKDVAAVGSTKPSVKMNPSKLSKLPIIIGTTGSNSWIDKLVKKKKISVEQITGQWESFLITVVSKPIKGVDKALVVVGSDRRGTAFGVFELSKMMGVSPWIYWADVKPEPRKSIGFLNGTTIVKSPSVKYRGIFLNDEDWGLKPWAAKHQDTDIEDIGPNTYAKIFELILRLKANFLWPAMHPCTKAFYYYPENPIVADKYAIIVGSSHCEPLLRNNVFEWKKNFENEYGEKPKDWRYDLNKQQIFKYWDDRADQSSGFESIYTIGMRGIHDGRMPGPKDVDAKIDLLKTVIDDQRGILENQLSKPANQIPQIFCPYKEVLTLYQRGIDLPEDVTIVWADDNHGYIRQLSTPQEQLRSGGSGVYYHLSYWGAPHDYLWLSSISPSLISYEMTKAYEYGADRLWVFNVGDIKPAELETEFAMDMAWDVTKWTPENAHLYAKEWAVRTFGEKYADAIAEIKSEYYRLGHAAKPEHMSKVKFSDDEATQRISDYTALAEKAETLKSQMPDRLQDAYFQLIYYPVVGAKLMNEKILFAKRSMSEMGRGLESSLVWAEKAKHAFSEIKRLTAYYNKEMADGKWDEMMDWKPRNLSVYKMPEVATQEGLDTAKVTASIELIPDPLLNLKASGYDKVQLPDGMEVQIINGLGIDNEGVSVAPFTWQSISDSTLKKAPYFEYQLDLSKPLKKIEVIALPSHRIHKGRSLRYAISVNNELPQIVDLNARSKSKQWKIDVLRGYHSGTTNHEVGDNKEAIIHIYILDPGLVINKLIVK